MSRLAAPSTIAVLAAALAVVLTPWVLPRVPAAVPFAMGLLLALSLLAAARTGAAAALIAGGAAIALGAVAYDAALGHDGVLELVVGQGTTTFDERGAAGESLGLRPLRFPLRLVSIDGSGGAELEIADSRAIVTAAHPVSLGGYRFGAPEVAYTGEVTGLRLAVSGPAGSQEVDVVPGTPARAGDLGIDVEQYFPDFALDSRQRPYSRSNAPDNPAAVLRVSRGAQSWRLFVLRSMPGIHQAEGLDRAVTLVSVDPVRGARLAVHQQPAARLVPVGHVLLAAGLALGIRGAARVEAGA